MIIVGVFSVIITVIGKTLGETFHPFQIMFFYCSMGALVLLPSAVIHYGCNKSALPTGIRWRYHLMRTGLEFAGFSLVFYSLIQLPLPMQTALAYTVPLFASLFAVLFVGEVITRKIAISLLLGMVGVCIIHNPFTAELTSNITLGIGAVILSSAMFGICGSLIKLSSATTPPLLIAMIMLTFTTIVATPFALSVWTAPTAEHLPWLIAFGGCTALVQYSVGRALKLGMITKLMPLTYLNLVWASLFAYFLFDELISERTIYGSLFIFGAITVVSMKWKKAADKEETSQQTRQP